MARAKPVSQEKLVEYCRRNGIKWLATHDAEVVRRHFPGVELFLLVEFEKDRHLGLLTLSRVQRELASLFGDVKTDLRTLPELRDFYRDEVLEAAEVQFAA
jgi:hypothetical protein